MVVSVGIDTVEIERIECAMAQPKFLERILTPEERSRCRSAETVAGRWAAKEAIWKCLPSIRSWQDVEILDDPSGKPVPRLALPPGWRVHISITHDRRFATAVAIMESDGSS